MIITNPTQWLLVSRAPGGESGDTGDHGDGNDGGGRDKLV